MTTPPPPTDPRDDRDDRDARVADWLAVDPLDDVTRARLVRAALSASDDATAPGSPPAGSTRAAAASRRPLAAVLGIAAAVLALVVVVGAVVAARGRDTSTTAIDAPASKAAPESSRATGDAAVGASPSVIPPAEEALVLPSIGDLGDVSDRNRLGQKATAALAPGLPTATAPLSGCARSAAEAFGTPVAVGTGRLDGRRATVVVSEQGAGSTAVVAVRGRSCGRAVSVVVP